MNRTLNQLIFLEATKAVDLDPLRKTLTTLLGSRVVLLARNMTLIKIIELSEQSSQILVATRALMPHLMNFMGQSQKSRSYLHLEPRLFALQAHVFLVRGTIGHFIRTLPDATQAHQAVQTQNSYDKVFSAWKYGHKFVLAADSRPGPQAEAIMYQSRTLLHQPESLGED